MTKKTRVKTMVAPEVKREVMRIANERNIRESQLLRMMVCEGVERRRRRRIKLVI